MLVERFKAGALYATGEPMLNDPQKMTLADARLEMAKFPDFIASISRLELLCARWNHTCLFLPKFHPELNPIELVWRDSKNELRRWCKCTSVRMKERWAETLDAITPVMIRKYFKSAMEFEAVYDLTIGFGNDPDPNAKVQPYTESGTGTVKCRKAPFFLQTSSVGVGRGGRRPQKATFGPFAGPLGPKMAIYGPRVGPSCGHAKVGEGGRPGGNTRRQF